MVNNLGVPSSAESSVKKEKGKDGKDKLKKNKSFKYISVQNPEWRKKWGVLPELCVVASPLGPATALASGSSSSTSPNNSLNLAFLADVNTLLSERKKYN